MAYDRNRHVVGSKTPLVQRPHVLREGVASFYTSVLQVCWCDKPCSCGSSRSALTALLQLRRQDFNAVNRQRSLGRKNSVATLGVALSLCLVSRRLKVQLELRKQPVSLVRLQLLCRLGVVIARSDWPDLVTVRVFRLVMSKV